MSKGSLEVISGPMFAGKTTKLLERVEKANGNAVLFKPSFDTRYGISEVKTHNGKGAEAISVCNESELVADNADSIIFIDEIQFFEKPNFNGDLVECVKSLVDAGHKVICSGLDKTWQDKDFNITKQLADIADTVTKLTAECSVCGKPATKSFKCNGNGSEVELGGADKYEPRCGKHFYCWNGQESEKPIDLPFLQKIA